ncbi:hypothetical protein ANTRET_LOCUS1385 [Anthophora retusa]
MENIPNNIKREMYYQQDGCPAHNSREVANYLNATFQDRIISTYGPIRWPARSPDLSPLDFFLWGYLQSVVYQSAINNIEELQERIISACRGVDPASLTAATHSNFCKRAEYCVAEGGMQFERVIK